MIKNILNFFDHSYKSMSFNTFDKVDPQLIKYFRTEYGQDWQSALTEHLYKKESSNAKKSCLTNFLDHSLLIMIENV